MFDNKMSLTEVSIRGKRTAMRSFEINGKTAVVKGRFILIAEIFDEYWLEAATLPDLSSALRTCWAMVPKPDLFTFAQRVPNATPQFQFFMEWDNVAVIPLTSYDAWFRQQINSAARRNIKAAANRGVEVRAVQYDDAYVRGIMAIYNESPIRQGRRFWHYGKDFAAVAAENGTYADRSTFLAAYYKDEMIGYLKVVWDEQTAAIMQIMSQMKHYALRPNNALLAECVKLCCERGIRHLQYERFIYGNKSDSSLTEFKRNNGFVQMEVPRYYVPISPKGALALKLGVHKDPKDALPGWVRDRWQDWRSRWYGLKKQYLAG